MPANQSRSGPKPRFPPPISSRFYMYSHVKLMSYKPFYGHATKPNPPADPQAARRGILSRPPLSQSCLLPREPSSPLIRSLSSTTFFCSCLPPPFPLVRIVNTPLMPSLNRCLSSLPLGFSGLLPPLVRCPYTMVVIWWTSTFPIP